MHRRCPDRNDEDTVFSVLRSKLILFGLKSTSIVLLYSVLIMLHDVLSKLASVDVEDIYNEIRDHPYFWAGLYAVAGAWTTMILRFIVSKIARGFNLNYLIPLGIVVLTALMLNSTDMNKDKMTYGAFFAGYLYSCMGAALVYQGGKAADQTPKLYVTSATIRPNNKLYANDTEKHGLLLTIRGTKKGVVTASQLYLSIHGDEFWKAANNIGYSAAISVAKMTFLPLSLVPKYTTTCSVDAKSSKFHIEVSIGTKYNGTFGVSQSTMMKQLRAVGEQGPVDLILRLEDENDNLLCNVSWSIHDVIDAFVNNNSANMQPLKDTAPESKSERKKDD